MNSSRIVAYRENVVSSTQGTTKLRWPPNFGMYQLDDRDVACGSLLGSAKLKVLLKATGAIDRVFCVDAGSSLLQNFVLKHWDAQTGIKLDAVSGRFFMHPEHQQHTFMLSNGVSVREDVFAADSCAYYLVDFTNESEECQQMATIAFCQLAQDVDDSLDASYDEKLHALIAQSSERPNLARVLGASRKPLAFEISIDHAKAVSTHLPKALAGHTYPARGLIMGALRYTTALEPGESAGMAFRLCVSAGGLDGAKAAYAASPHATAALQQTQKRYHDVLDRSIVLTPEREINRGVLWAKANMERVVARGPLGWGFTNDPTNSSNCVGRDAAWFCSGSDFVRPEFSAECLTQFLTRAQHSGSFVEYYNMLDGSTQDFDLNINDDTPLLVWSAWHHVQTTGDTRFLDTAYDILRKACRHIAAQRNGEGLVWCTSQRKGTPGIAGWRNVIRDYRLSGAVTEINAESYAAFRSIAALGVSVGDEGTAREFESLAADLRLAINRHLINPDNGLYYLNIDVDGTAQTDVTADLILPVVFGVAEPDMAERIVRRLSDRDFWTVGGMRTIPYDALNYSPDGASGCLGGVWNGVTFWYAKAAAAIAADFAARALVNGFENYARHPLRNNTVPGQFSEWLHGQTLVNQGMELSPWFPPRYVWAVIEGILGLDFSGKQLRIAPNLPSSWTWCGLRNMPYRGKRLTWFAAAAPEPRIWSTQPLDSPVGACVMREDVSEYVQCSGDDAIAVGIQDASRVTIMAGNTSESAVTTALRAVHIEGTFSARSYDSLRKRWQAADLDARQLSDGIPLLLAPKGFYLLELERL